MMPRFVGFIGPTYSLPSLNADCQRAVNLYPELDETGQGNEREVASFASAPGISALLTLSTTPIRGAYEASNGTLYAVAGNKLYSISSTWVATSLGTLSTSSGQVSMADDGFNLIIVDGTYGYDWNFSGATFTVISDPNFYASDFVAYIDSYFIFNKNGTQTFYISSLPSGTATDNIAFSGDVASAEGSPDNLIALMAVHRDLWLFGDSSTEVWFDSGANSFPFEQIQGAFIEYGCAAKWSAAKLANTVFWLGKDEHGQGVVVMANGYQPQRISNHAVEFALQSYSTIADAVAWTYQENGHSFYVLNFPTADATWVYDTTTNMWHERAYTSNGVLHRHRGFCHAFAYETHVVGDWQNGKLYKLSTSLFDDDGAPMTRMRVSPHLSKDMTRIFYSDFQLDMEAGVGIDGSGQGTDPQAILQFSNDGGHTWSNEKWASMGKIGQTKWRAIWRRLGQARDRVFKVTITEPVKVRLIGAELNFEQGIS